MHVAADCSELFTIVYECLDLLAAVITHITLSCLTHKQQTAIVLHDLISNNFTWFIIIASKKTAVNRSYTNYRDCFSLCLSVCDAGELCQIGNYSGGLFTLPDRPDTCVSHKISKKIFEEVFPRLLYTREYRKIVILHLSDVAIPQTRLKLEVKLLYVTNRNSHQTFRSPTSAMTFDDPEWLFLAHIDFLTCNISEMQEVVFPESIPIDRILYR